MQVILVKRAVCSALTAAAAVTLAACGGGGSGSSAATTSSTPAGTTSTPQTGSVPLFVSDASSDDWATIGVKILSIALIPQGGGTPVTVYTATTPAPLVNLEELDQIAEILGNVTVPVGHLHGRDSDYQRQSWRCCIGRLRRSGVGLCRHRRCDDPVGPGPDPGTQGATGNLTVPVNVNFVEPARGDHEPEQRPGSRVRSVASGIHCRVTRRWRQARRCGL